MSNSCLLWFHKHSLASPSEVTFTIVSSLFFGLLTNDRVTECGDYLLCVAVLGTTSAPSRSRRVDHPRPVVRLVQTAGQGLPGHRGSNRTARLLRRIRCRFLVSWTAFCRTPNSQNTLFSRPCHLDPLPPRSTPAAPAIARPHRPEPPAARLAARPRRGQRGPLVAAAIAVLLRRPDVGRLLRRQAPASLRGAAPLLPSVHGRTG